MTRVHLTMSSSQAKNPILSSRSVYEPTDGTKLTTHLTKVQFKKDVCSRTGLYVFKYKRVCVKVEEPPSRNALAKEKSPLESFIKSIRWLAVVFYKQRI